MKIISEARERESPLDHPSPPFKEKEKGGEGGSHAWWSMEDPMLGGPWNVKENTFSPLLIPLNNFTLNLQFFSFGLTVLLYHGPKPLLTPFFPLLRSINYDCAP